MKSYIGTKVIQAEPCMKNDEDGYKVIYEDGYESWSPKEVFERCYREITESEKSLIIQIQNGQWRDEHVALLVSQYGKLE